MDEASMHTIYWHYPRTILCDGTGKHYIRFEDTGEIEPHFTTCGTWWGECRWREDQPKDGDGVIRRKLRELTRWIRINQEKRWIRKSVWWWKCYYDHRVNVLICANKHCSQLFLLPGDPVVFMEMDSLDIRGLKKWPFLWIHLLVAIWNFIWGLFTAFQLHPPPFDASWRPGYMFHYECLPEPLKELFSNKVQETVERRRYPLYGDILRKFNEKLGPGLGQAIEQSIPSLRQAGIKVANAYDMYALWGVGRKIAALFGPIEDQIAKTVENPIEVPDIGAMTPKDVIQALRKYRKDEHEKDIVWIGNRGIWMDSNLYNQATEAVLGAIRQVDDKLAGQYEALCADFRKLRQFREVFGPRLGPIFLAFPHCEGLDILEFNYVLARNSFLRGDFEPLYRYMEGLKLSPFGPTRAWIMYYRLFSSFLV